jgi:hypothetical protein
MRKVMTQGNRSFGGPHEKRRRDADAGQQSAEAERK